MSNVLIQPIALSCQKKLDYANIAVLVDENTLKWCYPLLQPLLPKHFVVEIQSGEVHKNLRTCETIWNKLTQWQFDRKSLLLNLGGGVIGDMGGFCAATFKRGIDFIQIPTTLLSQVDASVGGKLGIDFNGFKNHIGIFQEPKEVWIDALFLKTIPQNQLISGFAEIVKHCLIADEMMWKSISQRSLVYQNWNELISHSVGVKQKIVGSDPTEKGLRKILNFGHTVGHAIESFLLDNQTPILHGEAIAAGMIAENFIAHQKNMINQNEKEEVEKYILHTFPKIVFEEQHLETIANYAAQDKKNRDGKVMASLLNSIGDCAFDVEISKHDIMRSLMYYKSVV